MLDTQILRIVYEWDGSTTRVSLFSPSLGESLVAPGYASDPGVTVQQGVLARLPGSRRLPPVTWQAAAPSFIMRHAERLQAWDAREEPGPEALAVLVSGAGPPGVGIVELTRALLLTVGISGERFFVATDTASTSAREPFRLPFVIGYAGAGSSRLPRLIDSILHSPGAAAAAYAHVRAADLRDREIDIAVTTPVRLRTVVRGARDKRRRWPRLLLVFDRATRAAELRAAGVPEGTSVLYVTGRAQVSADTFTPHLMRALAHDLPLHAAVRDAIEESERTDRLDAFRLYTAAPLLDSLRLADALRFVRQELPALEPFGVLRHAPDGSLVIGRGEPVAVNREVRTSLADWTAVGDAVEAVEALAPDFRYESGGLTDIAYASTQIASAKAAVEHLTRAATDLVQDETRLSQVERSHRRRVAFRLRELGDGAPVSQAVPVGALIVAGGRYLVDVGVGMGWEHDLVRSDVPAIDDLVPPVDLRSDLHVTLYADGAEVERPAVGVLALPAVGPSNVVSFTVHVPDDARRIRLRITVHYKGHLLQVHEIESGVCGLEDSPEDVAGLRANLVFSRNDALTLLDSVPERALTLIANLDIGGATHSIQSFADGVAANARLSEATVASWQRDTRALLGEAFDAFRVRKLTADAFGRILGDLAYRGRQLWRDGLAKVADSEMRAQLTRIRDNEALTMQVLRRAPELAIQWWLLYDWDLPTTESARRTAKLCVGQTPDGRPCGHRANNDQVICVRGFWGVRHAIEEFVSADGGDPLHSEIAESPAAPADGPIVLCTIADRVPSPDSALTALREAYGLDGGVVDERVVRDATERDSLLEFLSDEARRPAALIIVGHLEIDENDQEPRGPRVHLSTSERFLHKESFDPLMEPWPNPHRTVVFLLACEAGADKVGSLPSFVHDLLTAGAAAVVAAETEIDVQMAIDLISALLPAMVECSLGAAMRSWRRNCIARTDPSGLLFNAFGNSGVRLPAPSN